MALYPDLRHAVRSPARAPVFTAAAVASLTLGIATATTVFSLVDAAVLRPPLFAEAERLAVLSIVQHCAASSVPADADATSGRGS